MSIVLSVLSKIASLLRVASVWLKRVKDGIIKPVYTKIVSNKKVCWYLKLMERYAMVVLVFILVFQIGARCGQKKALATYAQWLGEYKAEQEAAAAEAVETDPYVIQLKHEATLMAKALAGIKDFNYDTASKEAFIQGAWNRVENGAFPDDLEQVLLQPGAFEMFDYSNKALEEDYLLAYQYLDTLHQSEFLLCDPSFVYIELGRDRVTLRDTLYKTSQTNYWRRERTL